MSRRKPLRTGRFTMPILNVLNYAEEERDRWVRSLREVQNAIRATGLTPLTFHRKQLKSWLVTDGGVRTYNTFVRVLWTVHVCEEGVIKFEVPDFPGWGQMERDPSPYVRKALDAWQDYLTEAKLDLAIGLDSPEKPA